MRERDLLIVRSALLGCCGTALCVVLLALSPLAAAQKLYKHVDKDGKVYYTDRPVEAGQKTMNLSTPNVASPEASRQLREEEMNSRREEYQQRNAAMRRQWSIMQRDQQNAIQQRQQYYRDHPEERPRPVQVVPYGQ